MSATGLETFDTTLERTHQWLNSITDELGFGDKQLAYHALRSTLHTLRDRLPVDSVAHLGAQLPMLVRGIYYEGWKPATNPQKVRDVEEFLKLIEEKWNHRDPMDYSDVARAVFKTINAHVTPQLAEQLRSTLPAEIQALWPEPIQA